MQQQPPFVNLYFGNPGQYNVNFKLNFEMRGQGQPTSLEYPGLRHYATQQHLPALGYQNQGYGTVNLPPQTQRARCRRHNITPCWSPECQEEEAASSVCRGGVPSNSWSYAGQPQHSSGNSLYPNPGTPTGSNMPRRAHFTGFESSAMDESSITSLPMTPKQNCFQNKRCDIF